MANVAGFQSTREIGRAAVVMSGLLLPFNWISTLIPLFSSTPPTSILLKWGWASVMPGLIAMILFFVWLYRAAANVFCLGRRISARPGMCVLWFFVPLANVVMPGRLVGQIEIASQGAEEKGSFAFAYAWWSAYMLSTLNGYLLGYLTRHGGDSSTMNALHVVGSVVLSVSFVMLVFTVRRISDGQDALYAAATTSASS